MKMPIFAGHGFARARRFSGRFLCLAVARNEKDSRGAWGEVQAIAESRNVGLRGAAVVGHGGVEIVGFDLVRARREKDDPPVTTADFAEIRDLAEVIGRLQDFAGAWVFEEQRVEVLAKGLLDTSGLDDALRTLVEQATPG